MNSILKFYVVWKAIKNNTKSHFSQKFKYFSDVHLLIPLLSLYFLNVWCEKLSNFYSTDMTALKHKGFDFITLGVDSIQWYQNLCSWLSICLILIFPICQKRIKNGAWTVLIFYNFALVVYMKILQYCFQSYFNLHRHHWGRVASINNIGFACCNIFNFSWFCRTNFSWSFTFHVFIFFWITNPQKASPEPISQLLLLPVSLPLIILQTT